MTGICMDAGLFLKGLITSYPLIIGKLRSMKRRSGSGVSPVFRIERNAGTGFSKSLYLMTFSGQENVKNGTDGW